MESNSLLLLTSAAVIFVQAALSIRVIMRRRPVGVTFAWLTIILALPFVGAIVYLLIGELRLGRKHALRAATIHGPYQQWLKESTDRDEAAWDRLAGNWGDLARLADSAVGIPPMTGNSLEILDSAEVVFPRLIADIDAAQSTCHLEFYIWNSGGWADQVQQALVRAADRGVHCRLLLDDVGSRKFLRGPQADELRHHGVEVEAALNASLFRALFVRYDLRLHRKIVVIDRQIGYAGSMNLVDPRYFKTDAGVGHWIDAMARMRGPAVEALGITFLEDWEMETNEPGKSLLPTTSAKSSAESGPAIVQVLPSGPAVHPLSIQDVLLTLIYAARHELVLTSPYFVPDEPLQAALIGAARRGVAVTLIVPAKEDSLLVRFASQAYRGDLVAAGVRVMEFHGGLLHTKSVTVDGQVSLFGSLNLDPRSFFLNFEVTLAVYDGQFASQLRELQLSYMDHCQPLIFEQWQNRSPIRKLAQNTARLLGPLL